MNIIIVGAGEIGRHMAVELSKKKHRIAVIESDSARAIELENLIEGRVIVGDGVSMETLAQADVASCELFLALTSENTVNLMSGSVAKALGVKTVVSRVHPGLQREELLFDFREHFGIDYLFSSERLAAIDLAKFIRNPNSLKVEEIARGRIELQQVRVSPKSSFVGRELIDLKLPARTRFASVLRDGENFIPQANYVVQAGDLVTIFGDPRKLQVVAENFQKGKRENDGPNVVIFGGSEYSLALAQTLSATNCNVRLFESNEEDAQRLADELSGVSVIRADATSVTELEEESVENVDFFVAASSSDEDNVMTCLQAHHLGVKNCLTLIHRDDYARAIVKFGSSFGVLAAVSPREAVAKEISRFVTSENYHVLMDLDHAVLIETQVKEKARVVGKTVAEVEWPTDCVLVGLINGGAANVPNPDDVLEVGAHVFAVVSHETIDRVLDLLHPLHKRLFAKVL